MFKFDSLKKIFDRVFNKGKIAKISGKILNSKTTYIILILMTSSPQTASLIAGFPYYVSMRIRSLDVVVNQLCLDFQYIVL